MSYVGITCYGQMYWGVGIDDDIIKSSISALVVAVNQVPSIKSSVEIQDKRLMEMKNYIQTNYQTVTLEDMAKQFHLSVAVHFLNILRKNPVKHSLNWFRVSA